MNKSLSQENWNDPTKVPERELVHALVENPGPPRVAKICLGYFDSVLGGTWQLLEWDTNTRSYRSDFSGPNAEVVGWQALSMAD